MENTPINYEARVINQTNLVKRLVEEYKVTKSEEKKTKLQVEMEVLRHYANAVKGNPKERGKKTYDIARTEALSQAVEQTPAES